MSKKTMKVIIAVLAFVSLCLFGCIIYMSTMNQCVNTINPRVVDNTKIVVSNKEETESAAVTDDVEEVTETGEENPE